MLKVGETKEIKVMLLDDDGNPTVGTISYIVYDENDASFAIGTMSTVVGVTGFYTMSFTPDAAGAWSVLVTCPDPNRTAIKSFDVGVGVEQDSYDAIVVLSAALVIHDTTIKSLLAIVQADLDSPNQYKADVSALALEATLTTIKGGGWTTETLKVIKDAIDTLDASLSTHDVAIKALIGTNVDDADMADTLFAGQQALFDNVHMAIGMIVADKTSLTSNETALKTALDKKFHVIVYDEDDIDAGDADLAICGMMIIGTSVTDMTKLNELTTLAVPIFTRNANAALTILRMGDDSGGSGTSYGETGAQTQINITNITHELTVDQTLGNLVVYSAGGAIQWVRKTDLVAGAVQLAEMFGDNTKNSMVVLPYDVDDEDGIPAPAIRVFIGLKEFSLFTAAAQALSENAQDWTVHQGAREIGLGAIGTIKRIERMLGRNKFRSAEDVFDYLVTGTTNANPFEVIASAIHGSVLERLNAMMEKDTSPAFDSDDDSLEAISEAVAAIKTVVDAIAGYLDTEIADIKTETDKIPRIVCKMDFTSLPLQVTLTSVAGDRGLVDVVVSGLPANVTIIAVQGIFYCDTVENSFDGVNYLESTKIQVKEKTAGTDRDAITLEANKIFRFTAQMVRGGTVLTADWATATDAGILAEVVGNATYQMWFDVGETVQNNIVLDGAVFVLRVWFSV